MRVAALHLVEHRDRLDKEGLAPLPVAKPFEARAAEDCAPRPKPLPHALDGRPSSKRETAEVELGELETRDHLAQIAREDALRIILLAVRLGALPVRAQVRHDHSKS